MGILNKNLKERNIIIYNSFDGDEKYDTTSVLQEGNIITIDFNVAIQDNYVLDIVYKKKKVCVSFDVKANLKLQLKYDLSTSGIVKDSVNTIKLEVIDFVLDDTARIYKHYSSDIAELDISSKKAKHKIKKLILDSELENRIFFDTDEGLNYIPRECYFKVVVE